VDQIDEVLAIALLPEKVKNATTFIFPKEEKEKEESGFVTLSV
jgi:ATP-dependent Lon protease